MRSTETSKRKINWAEVSLSTLAFALVGGVSSTVYGIATDDRFDHIPQGRGDIGHLYGRVISTGPAVDDRAPWQKIEPFYGEEPQPPAKDREVVFSYMNGRMQLTLAVNSTEENYFKQYGGDEFKLSITLAKVGKTSEGVYVIADDKLIYIKKVTPLIGIPGPRLGL